MRYYYKSKDGYGFLNLKEQINDENYIEITEQEFNELTKPKEMVVDKNKLRIRELKNKLLETDYQAIKYAEGMISEEDYQPIKVQRQEWRDEINKLEAKMNE